MQSLYLTHWTWLKVPLNKKQHCCFKWNMQGSSLRNSLLASCSLPSWEYLHFCCQNKFEGLVAVTSLHRGKKSSKIYMQRRNRRVWKSGTIMIWYPQFTPCCRKYLPLFGRGTSIRNYCSLQIYFQNILLSILTWKKWKGNERTEGLCKGRVNQHTAGWGGS